MRSTGKLVKTRTDVTSNFLSQISFIVQLLENIPAMFVASKLLLLFVVLRFEVAANSEETRASELKKEKLFHGDIRLTSEQEEFFKMNSSLRTGRIGEQYRWKGDRSI
jgi:hypothetical protein